MLQRASDETGLQEAEHALVGLDFEHVVKGESHRLQASESATCICSVCAKVNLC
eukprot:SAG11_NODE_13159_length_667_cov_1.623239_1_plen_53_part_10